MSNLSRVYRPKTFADIYGQSQVIETLRREVEQNKIGHAYLFSGPRGIGKTTAARIFAKAINCDSPKSGEPCLECASCKRIADNQAIDLIEIDAASHRGVTEVQESIIDHIKFLPASLKRKVYILDEAHMLTDHAWNALLKTIEEPPDYAVFIFATTERHKVPATIVSRCQRFEFSRIEPQEIIKRLQSLAEQEKVKVDDEVMATIASKTEGCLRDAENLLGQLMSLGEKKITPEIAAIVIPPSQKPIAAELLDEVLSHDVTKILEHIEELENQGTSFIPLFDDLIFSVRELLIAKNVPKHAERLKTGTEADKKLVSLLDKAETGDLVQASHILMERRREAKHGIDPRFALELGLVAIATLSNDVGRLGRATCDDDSSFNQQKQTEQLQDSGITIKEEGTNANEGLTIKDEINPSSQPQAANSEVEGAVPSPVASNIADDTVESFPKIEDPSSKIQVLADPERSRGGGSSFGVRLEDVRRIWSNLLLQFEDHKSLLFILKPARIVNVENNCISLKLEFAFHKKSLENAKNKQLIENRIAKLLNVDQITVRGVIDEVVEEESTTLTVKDTANSLIDAFGGELVG
ncbi:MAG: DNA polymerase III subunit gamma/tau [Patescibacteria group bacterium]|nr:DNA polymerase III subunit gamma/tau [Patescibacteria group bacterium]